MKGEGELQLPRASSNAEVTAWRDGSHPGAAETFSPPAALTKLRTVVVISDRVEDGGSGWPPADVVDRWRHVNEADLPWRNAADEDVEVAGSYLERLPLALIAAGAADCAEIWHHFRGNGAPPFARESAALARRAFRLDDDAAPFASRDMMEFIRTFGAPHILIVYGLGVAPEILQLCANSLVIYSSIDAPALRVPPEVSAHFDLVLTGAGWQSDVVEARHPSMPTAILPVGPEFAAIDQFRPLGTDKDVDLIYVAAAQGYKRHDILFDALAGLPRDVRALCVFGYGEDADALRARAAELELSVEFVGPPGVAIAEVNRLMNRARFGVVCGVDDGAPAILIEYMLAGLPVLANDALCCGLQFIRPDTGMTAPAERFGEAIMEMRASWQRYDPRPVVLHNWTWRHSAERLLAIISRECNLKQGHVTSSPLRGALVDRPLRS